MTPPSTPSATVAHAAAAAALACADVLELHGGEFGEIATYGGAEPVRGVRVRRHEPAGVKVHVVARFGATLTDVAEDVRRQVGVALAAHEFPDRATVDVHIADVRTEAEQHALEPAPGAGAPGEPQDRP